MTQAPKTEKTAEQGSPAQPRDRKRNHPNGSWNTDDAGRPRWGLNTTKLAGFVYRREDGSYAYEIWRGTDQYGDKVFSTRRLNFIREQDRLNPEDQGDYRYGLGDEKRLLYRLPELIAAPPDQWVYVVEGEKDVDTAISLGLVATTNPFGALKWRDEFSPYLKGRRVAIIPDADERGEEHAAKVARSILSHARQVRVIRLPGLKPGGDLSDWVEARRASR